MRRQIAMGVTAIIALLAIVLLVGVACDSQTSGNTSGNHNGNGSDKAGKSSNSNGTQTSDGQPIGEKTTVSLGKPSSKRPSYAGNVSPTQTQNALVQLPAASAAQNASSQPPELSDTEQPTVEDFIVTVAQDIDAFWAQEFEGFERNCQSQGGGASASAQASQYGQYGQYGQTQGGNSQAACSVPFTYATPGLVFFVGSTPSACGDIVSLAYCQKDQHVYVDAQQQIEHAQQYDNDSFIIATSIAHEFGHHVQNRLGYFDPNRPNMVVTWEGNPVPFENQADCLSGVWAFYAGYRGFVNQNNVINAMKYRASIGEPLSSTQTHGTPLERTSWWYDGFQDGDASQCTGEQFDTGSSSSASPR